MTASCDGDTRDSSADKRVARFVVLLSPMDTTTIWAAGTAFPIQYGYFVTAGHNIADAGDRPLRVQFNVPPSDQYGNPQFPDPKDQYAVEPVYYKDNGLGHDWAYFKVIDNIGSPILARGSFAVERSSTGLTRCTITGYGNDNRNRTHSNTQQTATNNFISNSASSIQYTTYTEVGNSGSPVIDSLTGLAVGIHTHNYCPYYRGGTSFLNSELWDSITTVRITVDQTIASTVQQGTIHIATPQGPNHIGVLQRWMGGAWEAPVSAPHTWSYLPSQAPINITLLADTFIYNNAGTRYKFHDWSDYRHTLVTTLHVNSNLTSYFQKVVTGATIKAELISSPTNIVGGVVEFKDPWLLDSTDADHLDVQTNRGISALFKQRSSPFYPNLNTSYNGDVYKGVFLEQKFDTTDPTKPYYSVRAPLTQTIGVYNTTFDHWEGTNADIIDIGVNTPGYDTKAAVFNSAAAIVTAKYRITAINAQMQNKWNMASVPDSVINFAKTAVWPSPPATSAAYAYVSGTGYVQQNTLANGVGYWIKYPSSQPITYTGVPIFLDTISVDSTWNIVGSISSPILTTKVTPVSPMTITSNYFGYRSGYYVADTIQPGSGYWIKVSKNGKLVLDASSAANLPPVAGNPPPCPPDAPQAPLLYLPVNGSTVTGTSPNVMSYVTNCANTYHIQVSSDSDFNSIVYNSSQLSYPIVTPTGLEEQTTYYWRVNATNSYGTSAWSTTWHFTTGTNGGGGCGECCAMSMTSMDEFTITDAENNQQKLFAVNGGRGLALGFTDFEMPPEPPPGIFNARFHSNNFIERVPRGQGLVNMPIKIRDAVFPITISWNSQRENNIRYSLVVPGEGRIDLPPSGSKAIGHSDNGVLLLQAQPDVACYPSRTVHQNPMEESSLKPSNYALRQNLPNPFNPSTWINYELPEDGHVTLKVYNLLGQEVATLVNEPQDAGYKTAKFEASNLPSGIYFYRLTAGRFTEVKKMLMMK